MRGRTKLTSRRRGILAWKHCGAQSHSTVSIGREVDMNDKMAGSLRLPLQAAPIDRTSSPAALNGSGVEASQLAEQIIPIGIDIAKKLFSGW